MDYDRRNHTLTIVFINRPLWVYSYKNFPPQKWVEFVKAQSKGIYFKRNIEGKFFESKSILNDSRR